MPSLSPKTTDVPTSQRRAQAAVQQLSRTSRRRRRWRVFQAVMRSRGVGAERRAPRRRRRRRCRRRCLRPQRACRARRRRSRPRPGTRARRRRSPTRAAGADQVGQALDLVGAARRRRSAPPSARAVAAGRCPASRGPCPTSSVSLKAASTPRLRQRQRIAGALQRPQLARRRARRRRARRGRRRARRRARRPPAARSTTRDAERACATATLAGLERDQFVVARDDRREAAVAADAGGELGADAGAPQLAAGVGLERDARCRRSPATVTTPAADRRRRAGTATLPMPAVPDLARRRSAASSGSSGVGFGLVGLPSRRPARQASSAGQRRRDEQRRDASLAPLRRPLAAPAGGVDAERGQLGLDEARGSRPSRPSPSRPSGRPPCASSRLPWASRMSPRRSATSASNSLRASAPSSCFSASSYFFSSSSRPARRSRAIVRYSVSIALSATQASVGARGVGLALVDLQLGGQQAAPAARRRCAGSAPSGRRRRAPAALGVAGLRGAVELVVHARRP